MTVGRYDDTTWAVYDTNGDVLASGFFTSQDAHDWVPPIKDDSADTDNARTP